MCSRARTKEREPATEGAQEHGHERLNHPVTERTFGFSGLIMNKEFKSKCLFFLMVPYSWSRAPTGTTEKTVSQESRRRRGQRYWYNKIEVNIARGKGTLRIALPRVGSRHGGTFPTRGDAILRNVKPVIPGVLVRQGPGKLG